jgi:hypothetical protein
MCRSFVLAAAITTWCALPISAQLYRAILLHPMVGFRASQATDVSTTSQVGMGSNTSGVGPRDMHALLWRGSRESVIDLHPPGFVVTEAWGAWENFQVGYGYGPATRSNVGHALLWSGTAESVVDLHPVGFAASEAHDVFGDSQVGRAVKLVDIHPSNHAMLWRGTSNSAVDLHPSGFTDSWAWGVDETSQVGHGEVDVPGIHDHALLWHGSAESVIDLHPEGYRDSFARDVSGGIQVGEGRGPITKNEFHALLWRGTAESVVDLHPPGYEWSIASAVEGNSQVGSGDGHALLWHGSADSVIDLHSFLGDLPVVIDRSSAQGINSHGDIVGYGFDNRGSAHAILWTVIPEPETSAVSAIGMVIAAFGGWRYCACHCMRCRSGSYRKQNPHERRDSNGWKRSRLQIRRLC